MYKTCIIGDEDSVMCFRAAGVDVFPCGSSEDAAGLLHRLAEDGYAIIYITEDLGSAITAEADRYREQPLPAVVSIPGCGDTAGSGMSSISSAVERAVGADILFGGEDI